MENLITIDKLNKHYGYGLAKLDVLKNISLQVKAGEILSIVGPSGAGKSTLLNMIGCLDSFNSGTISIANKEVSRMSVAELSNFRNRHLGFIFQMNNLLPEFTALENVMIPMLIRREKRSVAKKRAIDLIERFNLGERLTHKPSEMSGGECQRITVARAIATKPDLILADEPTGSLDRNNSDKLIDILFEIGREHGTTIVIVTHDQSIAKKTGRTISIVDGEVLEDKLN